MAFKNLDVAPIGGMQLSKKMTLEIVQSYDYEPFGVGFNGYFSSKNKSKFGYSNHEIIDDLSLNRIDFGNRTYNPTYGRFDKVDLMVSKRDWLTPYNYVSNNPILRIDPDGNFDDYVLSNNGSINLQKKTDDKFDKLISSKNPQNSIIVEKGVLDKKVVDVNSTNLSSNNSKEIFITEKNSEAKKVFEFAAENSNVEFNLSTVELNKSVISVLKTDHSSGSVNVDHLGELNNAGFKIINDFHNHTDNDPITSGFNEKGLPGVQKGGFGLKGDLNNAGKYNQKFQAVYVPKTKKYTYYDKNKANIPK